MRLVLVLYHWCRVRYYEAALLHLSQFDPMNEDLPMILDCMIQSRAVVDAWVDGRPQA